MAFNNPLYPNAPITRIPAQPGSEPEQNDNQQQVIEEQELERLESEVKQMATKILEYRTTLPDQLKTAFTSLLSAQRPVLPHLESGSDLASGDSSNPGSGEQIESSKVALPTDEERRIDEKIHLLKDKMSSNISTMPIVLNRMKECMSKLDKLDSQHGVIHPAFKRKTTN